MNQQIDNQTPKQIFTSVQVIYFALIIGQVAFLAVSYFINQGISDLHNIFKYIVPPYALIVVIAAPLFYVRFITSKIKPEYDLKAKLIGYRSANIVKFALMEGASLFSIVCLLLTGNIFYAYVAVALLMAFIIHRPTVAKCANDLHLNGSEVEEIQ